MLRSYVLNSWVSFTPGLEPVELRVQCVTLRPDGKHLNENSEMLTTTQSDLGADWSDAELVLGAEGLLAALYPTDEIEVLTLSQWQERWAATLAEKEKDKDAARQAVQDALARLASL